MSSGKAKQASRQLKNAFDLMELRALVSDPPARL
jgi:hypothetical protein